MSDRLKCFGCKIFTNAANSVENYDPCVHCRVLLAPPSSSSVPPFAETQGSALAHPHPGRCAAASDFTPGEASIRLLMQLLGG